MKKNIIEYSNRLLVLCQNYPLVLISSLSAGVLALLMVGEHGHSQYQYVLNKLLIACSLGISVFLGFKIGIQKTKLPPAIQLLGLPLLIGVYFLLPESYKNFSENYIYKLIPIFLLSHLWVSLSINYPNSNESNFWQFNKNLFVNAFMTFVFSFVLIGGVLLAILAVDKLFNLEINSNIYLQIFNFLLFFGSSVIFLLFTDKGFVTLTETTEYPKILKFFTQFILIPLLLIYALILYLYTGKIVLQWSLPYGWVSYLVLVYSVIGILALLLVYPLREKQVKSWVKIFSKVFFFTLIPLIVLLFIAIFTRISAYGITEPRYFVVALAVWLSLLVVYFIVSKKDQIQFIPITLALSVIFSLFMPYFNAFSMAKRSQITQLEKEIHDAKILKNNTIDFKQKISNVQANKIADIISFLMIRQENEAVRKWMKPEDYAQLLKENDFRHRYSYQSNTMNLFSHVAFENENQFQVKELIAENRFKKITDHIYFAQASEFISNEMTIDNDVFLLKNEPSKQLEISLGTGEKLDFEPLIKAKMKQYSKASTTLPEVVLEGDIKNYHIQMVFDRLSIYQENKKGENYFWGNPIIIIQKK
ncbi:MAG: DUF4153 domain-containing protein [Bacteroidetes bacterium]|nr:DUF4153 domain-containing protein [Bacteroidota bacterium]